MTNWFASSEKWAYSNRVWTVQTRTSSTSRRFGRSRTSTSRYSYKKYSKDFDSRNFREKRWSKIIVMMSNLYAVNNYFTSRSNSTSVMSSSSWTRRIAKPRLNFAVRMEKTGNVFCKSTSVFFDNVLRNAQSLELISLLREIFRCKQVRREPVIENFDRDSKRSWAKMATETNSFSVVSSNFWFLKRPSTGSLPLFQKECI